MPFESELVATLTGVTLEATAMLNGLVAIFAVGVVESVTCTVKLNVPEVVGVPVMAPVEAAKLNPGGNEPALMLQAYGVSPTLAARVAL